MSEQTPEVVVEAAPPAEPEGGDTTVVVAVDGGGDAPEPEGGDTTVVVVPDGGSEGAQDDATALDHEQRITRLEEQLGQVRQEVAERPTWEAVQNMTPSFSEVAETAAVVAAEVAEEVVEEATDEEPDGDGDVVVVEDTGPVVEAIDPQAPPVSDGGGRRKPTLLRW